MSARTNTPVTSVITFTGVAFTDPFTDPLGAHWEPELDSGEWRVIYTDTSTPPRVVVLSVAPGLLPTYQRAARIANALNRVYGIHRAPTYDESPDA